MAAVVSWHLLLYPGVCPHPARHELPDVALIGRASLDRASLTVPYELFEAAIPVGLSRKSLDQPVDEDSYLRR